MIADQNLEALQTTAAKPTAKQHLAAIRMLFDWLIIGQVLAINPAHAVRGPKHVVRRGKTPVLTEGEARRLLDSIDASTLVGLRSRTDRRHDLQLRAHQRRRRHARRGLLPRASEFRAVP
jgi:site-specific recombinase XerD